MYLQLKEIKWIPFCVIMVLVLRVAVTLQMFPQLKIVSYMVLGLSILFFLIYAFLYFKEKRMTMFASVIFLYFSFLIAVSFINEAKILETAYEAIGIFLMLFLFAYYHNNISLILQSFAFGFSAVIYANLAIMILFPAWMFEARDMFEAFLLGGNYNQMGSRLICGLITSVVCVRYSKWWILNSVALFIVSIATLALVGSMTSIANVILFGLFCIIPSLTLRKFAIASLFVIFILFQIFVVFNGEGIQHSELAVYVIEDVMGKDVTFTGRTHLWEAASRLFSESPLVGYGNVDMDWYKSHLSAMALGPHNLIFAILLEGGIVLFSLYLLICGIALRKIFDSFDAKASYVLMGVAVLMFMMIFEIYSMFFIIYLLTMCYYYKQIKESDKKAKQSK